MGIPIILEEGIQYIPILFFLPIIQILLLVGVVRYGPNSFKMVAIVTIIGFYQLLNLEMEEDSPLILITLAVNIGQLVLALYLESKFFPKYQIIKENIQGEDKEKQIIKYED
jgi:hypothetical protein